LSSKFQLLHRALQSALAADDEAKRQFLCFEEDCRDRRVSAAQAVAESLSAASQAHSRYASRYAYIQQQYEDLQQRVTTTAATTDTTGGNGNNNTAMILPALRNQNNKQRGSTPPANRESLHTRESGGGNNSRDESRGNASKLKATKRVLDEIKRVADEDLTKRGAELQALQSKEIEVVLKIK
jgi:hypothetical protein